MKPGLSRGISKGAATVVALDERRAQRECVHARLEALFREHQASLLRFLTIRLGSVADARDCLQLVFARLLERSASLADENLASLLYICARNAATDELRRRKHSEAYTRPQDEGAQISDQAPSPDRQAQASQELTLLLSLLDELPPKCRAAFVSYKLEGLEYREIAARMGITESMVRKYVIKAVAYCAARFEELQGWE
ncbi:MAG: RNA polymerase sigma factor [Xanthomonadaceae bacterium]|nr:RNA polymerase sigma factor [Xanthomonadaceae bacterium]